MLAPAERRQKRHRAGFFLRSRNGPLEFTVGGQALIGAHSTATVHALPRACLLRFRRGRPVDLRARTPACGFSPNRRRQWVGRLARPWTFREASPCGRDATIGTIPTSSTNRRHPSRPRGGPGDDRAHWDLSCRWVPFVVDSSEPAARPFCSTLRECCGDRRGSQTAVGRGSCAYCARGKPQPLRRPGAIS